MKRHVIIVAGGKGLRMGSSTPKQFIELRGKPIISHTIEAFTSVYPDLAVIVVIPEPHKREWDRILSEFHTNASISTVFGGETRFQSVYNGLKTIDDSDLVAVHDAVRPFPGEQVIRNTFDRAQKSGSAISVVPSKDSLRKYGVEGKSIAVPRSEFALVQTPQVFQFEILKEAYKQKEISNFTDDASVVEAAGYDIHLEEGSYRNIKITTPEDLILAGHFSARH